MGAFAVVRKIKPRSRLNNQPLTACKNQGSKGIGRVDELLDLVESDTTLPNAARASAKVLAQALQGLDKAIDDLEDEITSAQAQN